MMCHFYQEYFPEGINKISPEDLKKVAEILEKAYSDDVLNPIFLSMIEEEDGEEEGEGGEEEDEEEEGEGEG